MMVTCAYCGRKRRYEHEGSWMFNPQIRHILVDLDGVLVNFVKQACELFLMPESAWPRGCWSPIQAINQYPDRMARHPPLTDADFWRAVDAAGPKFWANMPPFPYTAAMLKLLDSLGVPWSVATSPSLNPISYAGKAEWLNANLRRDGKARRNWVLTSEKYLLARPDRLLIDDSAENCDQFTNMGGQAILWPQPWNHLHERVEAWKNQQGELEYKYIDHLRARLQNFSILLPPEDL